MHTKQNDRTQTHKLTSVSTKQPPDCSQCTRYKIRHYINEHDVRCNRATEVGFKKILYQQTHTD